MVYVRPLLQDNIVIWSPHFNKYDVEAIEHVQRWLMKQLPGFRNKGLIVSIYLALSCVV